MTLKERLSEGRKKALEARKSCYKARESSIKEEELKKEAEHILYNKLWTLFEQIHDAKPTESLLKVYIRYGIIFDIRTGLAVHIKNGLSRRAYYATRIRRLEF